MSEPINQRNPEYMSEPTIRRNPRMKSDKEQNKIRKEGSRVEVGK
jgi:hypothetical protein